MKKLSICLLLIAISGAFANPAKAQDPATNAGAYITAINTAENGMNRSYMSYISAAAHSSRKRKIDKMREQAVQSILVCQSTILGLSPYNGDNSLRQSSLNFVQLCYKIFNEDYAHIVNMEEIAVQSYDDMHAYLLLQEATDDTLKAANLRMTNAVNSFAGKYGVMLSQGKKTELNEKMEATNKLGKYRNKIYLLFFKCNWEDGQLTLACNQKDLPKIAKFREALGKYAIEGLAVLDTMKGFDNDLALAQACKQALTFYKTQAETNVPAITDFFAKEQNFLKLKTAMEAKAANQRTQQDVDTFNKAVSDINASSNSFNQLNNDLNNSRNELMNNWTNTEKQFLDAHTPFYKG
jgi:hypothetical protein